MIGSFNLQIGNIFILDYLQCIMAEKNKSSAINLSQLLVGIVSLVIAFFFLFTEKGKGFFVPLTNCPAFLQFYYYLISYGLVGVGVFFLLRSFGIIKR